MDNLPPCPFCGGDARVIRSSGYRRVMCWSCNAQTGYAETEAEVVHAWNTRTPAPSSLPEVGELKAAAARIKDWLQGMQATDAIELTNKRYSDLWQLLDAALATDGSEDEHKNGPAQSRF